MDQAPSGALPLLISVGEVLPSLGASVVYSTSPLSRPSVPAVTIDELCKCEYAYPFACEGRLDCPFLFACCEASSVRKVPLRRCSANE